MADNMEELAEQQTVTGQQIQRIISNYNKDPETRKTASPYYEERLQRLEDAWQQFESTDKEIRILPDIPLGHNYFTKEYYNSIQALYKQYQLHFEGKIQTLNKTKATGTKPKKTQDDSGPAAEPQPKDYTNEKQELQVRRQKATMSALGRLLKTIEEDIKDPHSRAYYTQRIKTIEDYWEKIARYHIDIMSNPLPSLEYKEEYFFDMEVQYQDILIALKENIESTPHSSTSQIRLPKITIPTFDGNYLQWSQFHDIFEQLIHRSSMSNSEKMFYLKANLTGEASKIIQHLQISADNYNTAWILLNNRYDNKRVIVSALLNKLMAQPNFNVESAASLRKMHDTTREALLGIENLGIPTQEWSPIIVHMLLQKIDQDTHKLFEQTLDNHKEIPDLENFLQFLETRFQALESMGIKNKNDDQYKRQVNVRAIITSPRTACVSCNGQHALFACHQFLKAAPANRLNLVRRHNLCINCLKTGHHSSKCTSRGCTKCNQKHNTLVHFATTDKSENHTASTNAALVNISAARKPSPVVATLMSQRQPGYVILGTSRVKLISTNGIELECRAILDSGSQINIISERLAKRLGVTPSQASTYIQGIGQSKQRTQRRISVQLKSIINGYSARIEAFVLDHIISSQPSQLLNTSHWPIPNNIKLADPDFHRPARIDLLIGAELFFQLLSIGQIKLGNSLPTLQNTVFGWIVTGKINQETPPVATCGVCSEEEEFTKAIERFWEIEDIEGTTSNNLTMAQQQCETHFVQTTKREQNGRFIVRLPFNEDPKLLGESRDIALRRFESLERKLSKQCDLRQQYVTFMDEYLKLGHMEEVDINSITSPHYFLPHHSVMKPDSTTTKLRVVFDASAKTSTNLSLNDVLHTGPTLQEDLFSILLRFRLPRFVFTADIQKMYRQILLHEDDRNFQLICWRNNPSHPLKCYRLRTITYGTSTAPYLAIRCLQRLAQEESSKYPIGSALIKQDFYVDDVMTGADSIVKARDMQTQLRAILKEAGFELRKWCANHPQLLRDIPPSDQEVQLDFTTDRDSAIKTLGLIWLPKSDQFGIKYNPGPHVKVTKRTVSSDIARLFDPLGILAPVIVTAKMFLQQLWDIKLDWDAALAIEFHTKWVHFRNSLPILNQIKFPRHVFGSEIPKNTQLHVFSDASEKAYGAAIYIRSTTKEGRLIVRLLCSKSKVAPTKRVTLPRLELCAAKLAAELADRVKRCLDLKNTPMYFWTDSEIVLSWINSKSANFQIFVGNRIAAIQRLSLPQQWRHVRSKDNPADPLSRGIPPEKLSSCNLWFYGPPFLHSRESIWPAPFQVNSDCQLEKKAATVTTAVTSEDDCSIIYRINHKGSFRKLQRIVAYMLRFIKGMKKPFIDRPKHVYITCPEIEDALHIITRAMQEDEFKTELKQLMKFKCVHKKNRLSSLSPFLDESGIIRVGGRLEHSSLSYNAKHPTLLPYSDPLTKLLMIMIHRENVHTRVDQLIADTRQRFWPLRVKTIARSIVNHCVTCAKDRPKMLTQLMGNLPSTRVQPARPFVNSGVDFAGPIWIHYKIRGKRPHKAYLAVFCCFATKAVHLEIVSDLSTEAFIGALKRFTGRRGNCRNLYCDNATNFVGARNQLQELKANINSEKARQDITETCNKKGIEFHFIPPRAPHFGGLWEAAVKSAKYLLLKTTSAASLTYEELETLMVEIEAILNSRPLTQMSSDPNDLSALTPGHFLIGEPMTSTIDTNAKERKVSLLTRWNLVSHLKHEFWRRWSREYLNELQHRYKWKEQCQNINPGTIVIIQEDNVPTMKWSLGRIIKTHKGEDGLVRVADVQTATGILRRPIHKLSPLPCEDNDNEKKSTNTSIPPPDVGKESTTKKKRDDERQESTKKKVRRSYGNSIVSLLLACMILPIIHASGITMQQFESKPGIYFENVGTTSMIASEWNIVVYYDLRPYWMELFALSNSTKALNHLCQRIRRKSMCTPITNQFMGFEAELQIENSLLATRRRKRGALDIIGNVANSLFGVLDSKYAEKMSQTIDVISRNEGHLLSLLRNQTSLIDSTINVLKRDQTEAEKKFKEIDNQINELVNRINHTGDESYELKLNQYFISLSIQLSLSVINLQKTQTSIIDVLTDIHHGRINPLLVTPQQIERELSVIKNNLPPSVRLPTDQGDMIQIYRTMTAASRIVKNHVIIKINIPLVKIERFDLFKMIPIPAIINGTFIAIRPCSTYIALNQHKDHYYPMTSEELSSCFTTENVDYLCHQTHPLYNKIDTRCSCETNLINNAPYDQCHIQEVENSPVWIQLNHPNQWIYGMKEPTIANALCKEEITPLTLNNSGLLEISPDCVIKHDLLTIQGTHTYPSSIRTSYQRLNNVTRLNIPVPPTPITNNSSTYTIQREQLELLKELVSTQFQQEATKTLQSNNTHELSIGYSALALAIVITCGLLFRYRETCKTKPKKPTPAPRQLKDLDFSINIE